MSHYQSYKNNPQPKKYPSEGIPNYLGKKRSEKRYDYEDKYYDKYPPSKYHVSYQKGYHNKYHNDYYYQSSKPYHNPSYQSKQSPRRDYKKNFQKYPSDDEGVRNLSHCDLPSPNKNNEPMSFNAHFNFPKQPNQYQQPFQHIVQNQQNISISIISPNQVNLNSSRHFSAASPIKERCKDSKADFVNEQNKFTSAIPKPIPKLPLSVFDKKSVNLADSPFETNIGLPLFDDINYSSALNEGIEVKPCFELKPCYLLSMIPNKALLSNLMDVDSFNNLYKNSFDLINFAADKQTQIKSPIVYDQKYENLVEHYTKKNKEKKEKLMNEIKAKKKLLDYNQFEIRKLQFKIFENNWKFDQLSAKVNAIQEAINK